MESFKTAPSLPDFVEAEYFAIHMLAQEHHQLSGHFAQGAEDKFAGIAHQQCNAGVPILSDALATLVCRNVNQYEGGDHLILLAKLNNTNSAKVSLWYSTQESIGLLLSIQN